MGWLGILSVMFSCGSNLQFLDKSHLSRFHLDISWADVIALRVLIIVYKAFNVDINTNTYIIRICNIIIDKYLRIQTAYLESP